MLAGHPDTDVRVLVIWEPVLQSDRGPPTDGVREKLAHDPRVVEFWDPDLWVSSRAIERMRLLAEATGEEPPAEGDIAWDFVATYPAGAVWEDPFPTPTEVGVPVVSSLELVEALLRD